LPGGGIGGLAAALALVRRVRGQGALNRRRQLGEIGAGIQPPGRMHFAAFDALGIGEIARGRAVYTDEMVMHDALDETLVGRIPTGTAFRARFGNPYAVIHRADVHGSLLEGQGQRPHRGLRPPRKYNASSKTNTGVTVFDANGGRHRGVALIGPKA